MSILLGAGEGDVQVKGPFESREAHSTGQVQRGHGCLEETRSKWLCSNIVM